MVAFVFYFIIIAFVLLIVGGITYLFYSILRSIGYPKLGLVFASIPVIFAVYVMISPYIEKAFFSKSDAKELLKEQGIVLQDDFEIVENDMSTTYDLHGDYSHEFTLKISDRDRANVMANIKNANGFIVGLPKGYTDNSYYTRPKGISKYNFESEFAFVRYKFDADRTISIHVYLYKHDGTLEYDYVDY